MLVKGAPRCCVNTTTAPDTPWAIQYQQTLAGGSTDIFRCLHSSRRLKPLPNHDDVIKWKHFPRYWPFVRGMDCPHKGQWRGALICAWTRLSKQSRCRWFETPSHSLWRHCNVAVVKTISVALSTLHFFPDTAGDYTYTLYTQAAYMLGYQCGHESCLQPIRLRSGCHTRPTTSVWGAGHG